MKKQRYNKSGSLIQLEAPEKPITSIETLSLELTEDQLKVLKSRFQSQETSAVHNTLLPPEDDDGGGSSSGAPLKVYATQ